MTASDYVPRPMDDLTVNRSITASRYYWRYPPGVRPVDPSILI